ncbi:MAG: proton-conducting transporter membrane subunit [Akkermansiaceae bacterium]
MTVDSPLIALPLALPILAVGILLCMRRAGEAARHTLNILTCTALLVVAGVLFARVSESGVLVLRSGSWPAPFGITLVADLLSAVMVLVTAVVGLAVAIYAAGTGTGKFRGYFTPLYQALLMGVNGSFLTGDLFNLYVWFEVMLMASFVLVALPGGRAQLEAAVKYLTLNFIASAFFLVGLGVLYGMVGTLNMADLSVKLVEMGDSDLVLSSAVLFLVAFGIKAGVFPFYFWLPSSYHVTPTPVAAVFAGLLTKVGVYACIRVFTLVYSGHQEFLSSLLLPIGVLTMVTGVFGAASQFYIPRILSFHIISQIGYMIVGLGLFTRGALAATVFYIVHHILVKTNLFLIGGIIGHKTGTQALAKTGGIYRKSPWLAVLFLIPAMSLGGIPPLSGFFAKFALVREGLALGQGWVIAAALAVGLLTLYSMVKIWNEAFWKDAPAGERQPDRPVPVMMMVPAVALALGTVVFGIFPGVFMDLAMRTADQLTDPSAYIKAVLQPANPIPAAP